MVCEMTLVLTFKYLFDFIPGSSSFGGQKCSWKVSQLQQYGGMAVNYHWSATSYILLCSWLLCLLSTGMFYFLPRLALSKTSLLWQHTINQRTMITTNNNSYAREMLHFGSSLKTCAKFNMLFSCLCYCLILFLIHICKFYDWQYFFFSLCCSDLL